MPGGEQVGQIETGVGGRGLQGACGMVGELP